MWLPMCETLENVTRAYLSCYHEHPDPGFSDEYQVWAIPCNAITSDFANTEVFPPKEATVAS